MTAYLEDAEGLHTGAANLEVQPCCSLEDMSAQMRRAVVAARHRKGGSLQSWLISKILPLYFIISVGQGHVGSRHALFLLVVPLEGVLDAIHL